METIYVKIVFESEPITVEVSETTTVEDVLIEICKRLQIGPVAKPLFALKQSTVQAWLNLSHVIWGDEIREYKFAMRFKVPYVDRLRDFDENAYDFYFRQARHYLSDKKIPTTYYDDHKAEIIGLAVLDMYRATVEDNLPRDVVIRNFKNYVPRVAKKKHSVWFLKTPIINKFNEIRPGNENVAFIKNGYLEQFHKVFPQYMIEDFCGVVNDNICEDLLRVNPFDTELSGISIKYNNKQKWEHLCAIDELCYLTKHPNGTVWLGRKNGIPLQVTFRKENTMMSFITVVDGYYRLMVKWTFNLCADYATPSLTLLKHLKCHGPVSGEFAHRKLAEKRNNESGCYILRKSDISYDDYYIDVCTRTSHSPVTYRISQTENHTYKLEDSENEYSSLRELLREENWASRNIELKECLPPSEFDQSNLLLCRMENGVNTQNQANQSDDCCLPLHNNPACIDPRTLKVFKNEPLSGHNLRTIVYRGVWEENSNTKRNIAMKKLSDMYQQQVKDFLDLSSRWAFVNAGAVVKVYGFTLSPMVSMIMEYLPYGPLDAYLADAKGRFPIAEATLVEASVALANALYYMEEAGFVHGYIRCRKLLVAEHTKSKFIVKLADPSFISVYQDTDLHWIPPEYHDNTNEARSSVNADVWAFATTLWEIFSYGKKPTPADDANAIKQFYTNDRLKIPAECPPRLYCLMKDCWHSDADARKKPQEIMRDINRIFYQVYNCPKNNTYTQIDPKIVPDDNISGKSMTSDEISSVQSDFTVNTTVGDINTINPPLSNEIVYRKIEMELLPNSPDPRPPNDFHTPDSTISSLQSIYRLEEEWNLVFQGRIGEGFFGEVYKGQLLHLYEQSEQKVAIKKLKPDLTNVGAIADFKKEIQIMKKLDHPNIVKLKGVLEEPDRCLVLEYIEQGSLLTYLKINKERLTLKPLLKFASDVAQGMNYLSELKIVHRDLAARNILVVSKSQVKISDFGLARFTGADNYYLFETDRELPVKWYAPESIEKRKFSPQSDVWSYGVTLYEMFTYGAEPVLPNVKNGAVEILDALKKGIRLPMPPKCPQYLYAELMCKCWNYEPSLRPSFDKICKFFVDNIWCTP